MSLFAASRSAVDAMSSTVDTNSLRSPVAFLPMGDEPQYAHRPRILLVAWGLLLAHAAVLSAAAWWTLRRRR
jgi:hypothetical protein